MKFRKLYLIVFFLGGLLIVYSYYYYRWKEMWALEAAHDPYAIVPHAGDTLRIGFIGDSWAGMRTNKNNSYVLHRITEVVQEPVVVISKGKGGEKSRGIYRLLFEDQGYGFKPVITAGLGYCVVFAGINDAAANLGTRQYCHNMKLIIDFLLRNGIRPVIVEIPDVNIWNVYGGKPLKDLLSDYMRSYMTHCGMYHLGEYREALSEMIEQENYSDQILFVPMQDWNGSDTRINRSLFLEDQVHLNNRGYHLMDSCIVETIVADLKNSQNTALVNEPVNDDTY